MYKPAYISQEQDFYLVGGDCVQILPHINFMFDMVFADPPYFLSNGGMTVKNGIIESVDKGDWDKLDGSIDEFNLSWLSAVRDRMKPNATIWISGTYHNIFSIGQTLTQLGFKILNIVTWEKLNPPPNFSCRTFVHSSEFIIWARKSEKEKHYFNYDLMKRYSNGCQMRDVWHLSSVTHSEKLCGKHPTQKPIELLSRIIEASTEAGAWILDPFAGSSTTGIAANMLNRKYVGIEKEAQYIDLSVRRKEAMSV